MRMPPGLPGFLLFLAELPIFFYDPKIGVAISFLASAIINSITDFKWRYVDDQYVYQSVFFSFAYSYLRGTLHDYTILFLVFFTSSLLMYVFGAWSSGDITATTSSIAIFPVVGIDAQSVIQFILFVAIAVFVPFFIIGAKKCGRQCFKVQFKNLFVTSIMAPGYVALSIFVGQYSPLAALLLIPVVFLSRKIYYLVSTMGYVPLIAYALLTPQRYALVFFATLISVYIFRVSRQISKMYLKKVPGKLLKEGDVISEMIIEDPDMVLSATFSNIMKLLSEGKKITLKPSAEGLTRSEIDLIHEKFANNMFTVKETVFVAPFIYVGAILFFLWNIYF